MSYRLPLLLFVSLRGWPESGDDEEHHAVMGASTEKVFAAVGVRTHRLDATATGLSTALDLAGRERRARSPLAVLVPRHTVGPATQALDLGEHPFAAPRWQREEAIRALGPVLRAALVVSTTGMISRELFGAGDRPENFYMQGSMGQAIGIGIGAARARPDRRVVVLDGDGSALMQLGGAALAGETAPANLVHVVLDNGVYDSTGGQRTRARSVEWADLAMALGYRSGVRCAGPAALPEALARIDAAPGPHLLALTIDPGGNVPPRISAAWRNPQITDRFRRAATEPAPSPSTTRG